MKKAIITLMTIFVCAALNAQTLSVTENATYYKAGYTITDDTNHSIDCAGFGSDTVLAFDSEYVDITAESLWIKDVFVFNADITGEYALTDNLNVFAAVDYTFVNATKSEWLTNPKVTYNHLRMYVGAEFNTSWKMFDIGGKASIGYNCIDTMNYSGNTWDYTKSEGNSMYVNLEVDITVWKYITFYAGMDSYQTVFNGNVLTWLPSSVNNYIGIKAEYPLNDMFTIVGGINHECRHPELPNYKANVVDSTKENTFTKITLGVKMNLYRN